MKFISFNPWQKVVLKSIIEDDNPMAETYAKVLKEHGDYFIGVTDPEEEGIPGYTFEELNIVAVDEMSFADILEAVKKEIDNEELIEALLEVY